MTEDNAKIPIYVGLGVFIILAIVFLYLFNSSYDLSAGAVVLIIFISAILGLATTGTLIGAME